MSRGSKTIYVGNLPPSIRTKDVQSLFEKYGKIRELDLKNSRGPPFAFIEYEDERDAEDAVRGRDTYNYEGYSLRVEFPRSSGAGRDFGGRGGGRGPARRGEYRIQVTGLPPTGSWQDLKDMMREIGDVGFADVRGSVGYVEFVRQEDMKRAIKKMDGAKFRSHEGETSYIHVKEDRGDGGAGDTRGRSISRSRSRSRNRSRSRSRSPPPRRRGSPTYSPMRKSRSRSSSYSK